MAMAYPPAARFTRNAVVAVRGAIGIGTALARRLEAAAFDLSRRRIIVACRQPAWIDPRNV